MNIDQIALEVAREVYESSFDVSGQRARLLEFSNKLLARIAETETPVAWLPSAEWKACTKLPVTVHVRAQREGETHVSTREGITPIKPDDLIMRGVQGEEYPIGREVFERTYRMGEAAPHKPDTEIEPVPDRVRINELHDEITRYRAVMEQAMEKMNQVTTLEQEDEDMLFDAITALREALKEGMR